MHQLESFQSNYIKHWGVSVLETQLFLHRFVSAFLDWTLSREQLLCTNMTILTCVHVHAAGSHWLGNSFEKLHRNFLCS